MVVQDNECKVVAIDVVDIDIVGAGGMQHSIISSHGECAAEGDLRRRR